MRLTSLARNALVAAALLMGASCQTAPAPREPGKAHNVILFVADGLRYGSVNRVDAPAFAAVRDQGVDFTNSHALYPTVTTVNGAVIATGHYVGDTGNFGNALYVGAPLREGDSSRVALLENNSVLAAMNARFAGNYLNAETLLAGARRSGYAVAALGKTGPTAIADVTSLSGPGAIIIDGAFDAPDGPPLPPDLKGAVLAAGLPTTPPARAAPNSAQTQWLTDITTKVLLPRFKAHDKGFVIMFWSSDPDATQHNQSDSRDNTVPGVNGATSKAAIRSASDALAAIRAALKDQGLEGSTDIFVTADHGFSTAARPSQTSASARMGLGAYPSGQLPPGFLAIDIARLLNWRLYEPDGPVVALDQGLAPRRSSALIGPDFETPHVVVAANGGTDLIWLPQADAPALAPRIVEFLTTQDYTSAIFVNDALGPIPGALKMSDVGLIGQALTPQPAIVVSFRSWAEGCAAPVQCAVEISEGAYRTGQGVHGALHRGTTRNFMAAIGPSFKAGFDDRVPVGNADVAPTLARILGIELSSVGALKGRPIGEALRGGRAPDFARGVRRSAPAANGFVTTLEYQSVGAVEYYDAAGAPGRAVGLRSSAEGAQSKLVRQGAPVRQGKPVRQDGADEAGR